MNMQTTVGEPPELKKYSGIERAAALMLALGKDYGAPIWEQMSIDEVKELSSCISTLGRVPSSVVMAFCTAVYARWMAIMSTISVIELTLLSSSAP